MRRASAFAAAAALAWLAAPTFALADDEPHAARDVDPTAAKHAGDPRAVLIDQLAAQAASIEHALATVTEKLAAADAARVQRVRAAYRIVQPLVGDDLDAADRMADARRRAAARLLLDRDAAERGLLADEADHLRAAAKRVVDATARALTIPLPAELAWPASPTRGSVARHFGTIEHDKSHTTLSRRGIDIEVEDHMSAIASADGTVRYAGPIRGLDNGVIVDHGDYLTVIGKLGELAVPVGAPVHRGDRLGRAARHRLYFEVRVKVSPGGLAVDPEPLFAHVTR